MDDPLSRRRKRLAWKRSLCPNSIRIVVPTCGPRISGDEPCLMSPRFKNKSSPASWSNATVPVAAGSSVPSLPGFLPRDYWGIDSWLT
jgi:hypothetical protein